MLADLETASLSADGSKDHTHTYILEGFVSY